MKKVLYILNDCMRKFSYERSAGLYQALQRMEEPVDLYIVRSDGYSGFAPEHNCGEYNIFRLPDYSDFDGIFLDVNSIFNTDEDAARGALYAVQAAAASGKPVISMANDLPGFYYVGIDNYAAMQSVIRYLHREMGLTDFWFVMGPPDNYENYDRAQGLLDYCKENGLACGDDRFFSESFIIECGIHAFRALRARHDGTLPQAVICANDHIALGICHAAEEAGFQIPRDFLVTGFDNTDVSSYLSPSITTVDQVAWSMGEACVDTMRRIWQGEKMPHRICTPTELVLRESTGHHATAQSDMRNQITDYITRTSSTTDFNYKLSAMQYQLPGCKSVEEMGDALVRCLSIFRCKGVDLILDSDLQEYERLICFDDQIGRMRDAADGMPTEGYSDNMEIVYSWRAGEGAQVLRQKVGHSLAEREHEGGAENYLYVPLHFMENTVGYLVIWDCLDLLRVKGVSAIASTLTMALRTYFAGKNLAYMNQVLSGMSMKDDLTGLYNRLGYHHLAYPLFRELRRSGKTLGILFVDMDRLKFINDSYGHAAGDNAIRGIANAITRTVPEDAIPIRYGGDEFLILIPDVGEERVKHILDELCAALPEEAKRAGAPNMLDISAGYVITDTRSKKSLDQYVHTADAKMYRVKKAKGTARA